jgi:hypothetical protein
MPRIRYFDTLQKPSSPSIQGLMGQGGRAPMPTPKQQRHQLQLALLNRLE